MSGTDYVVLGLFLSTAAGALFYLREKSKLPPLISPKDIEDKVTGTDAVVSSAPTETGKTQTAENEIKHTQAEADAVAGNIEDHKTNIENIENEKPSAPVSNIEDAKNYFDDVLGGKK